MKRRAEELQAPAQKGPFLELREGVGVLAAALGWGACARADDAWDGADHPHPTPLTRDAAHPGSERAASAERLQGQKLLPAEAQCPHQAAAAQGPATSSALP